MTSRRTRVSFADRLVRWFAVSALLLSGVGLFSGHSVAAPEGGTGSAGMIPINQGGLTVRDRPLMSSGGQFLIDTGDAQVLGEQTPFELAAAASAGKSTGAVEQLVPFRNPAPSFSRNLLITRNYGYAPFQTEPAIAVDPTDPDHVVMATIDYNMGSFMSSYVSFDGGETWDGPHQVLRFRNDYASGGDPALAFDRDGNLFVTALSFGVRDFVLGTIASQTSTLQIVVAKSTDGGLNWSDPSLAAVGKVVTVSQPDDQGKERGSVTFYDNDKPWIAVGPSTIDQDNDVIYVSYTEFQGIYSLVYADELAFLTQPTTATTIMVVKSEDGGTTWSAPYPVSPTVYSGFGLSGEGEGGSSSGQLQQAQTVSLSSRYVQGSFVQVGPDSTVYVCYYDSTDDGDQGLGTVQLVSSADDGQSFSEAVVAGTYLDSPYSLRSANFRTGGLPQMAIGPDSELYIVQAARPPDKPTDDGDVYLFRSFDKGATWNAPVRVNQDDTDRNQFFPAIATSPDGAVHIMWGDMRDDPVNLRYNIYYTESTDQGETFGFKIEDQDFTAPDTRVTDFPSNPQKGFPGGRFVGDYFGIAATDDDVFAVWADTRMGEYGGYGQNIGFARKTAIDPPSLFLNPPSGSAGRTVDIQGFNFQPLSNVQIYVSGVYTAVVRSDELGQFTTRIYMPLTGEGPTDITAYDDSGNQASASFYTEFGFDSLERSLDAINQQLGLENQGGPGSGTPEAEPEASPTPTS